MGTSAWTDALAPPGRRPSGGHAPWSDEALARRVRAGDERAFEALYERYRDRLHRYCASILHQPEDAEEALQSAMLGAYRSLRATGERDLAVRPWLYRIAHNQCLDIMRRRPVQPAAPLSDLEASRAPGPAERLEVADELARLREDLLLLPAGQRAALVLRELSGLSHEQIGEVLGESAAGAKQVIYQARLALAGMAEGRRMECDEVRRRISDGDGRILRARGIRAHLRSCAGCAAFRAETRARPGRLAVVVPAAPLMAADRILDAVLGAGGGGGGGAATASGALSGLGGGLGAKLAVVASVGVIGGSVAVVPAAIDHRATGHRDASPATAPAGGGAVVGGATVAARAVGAPPPTRAATGAAPREGARLATPTRIVAAVSPGSPPVPAVVVVPPSPGTPAAGRGLGPAVRPVAAPSPATAPRGPGRDTGTDAATPGRPGSPAPVDPPPAAAAPGAAGRAAPGAAPDPAPAAPGNPPTAPATPPARDPAERPPGTPAPAATERPAAP